MKFAFILEHRSIGPAAWLCEALGVSQSSFHAWSRRAPGKRALEDEDIGAKTRASLMGSA